MSMAWPSTNIMKQVLRVGRDGLTLLDVTRHDRDNVRVSLPELVGGRRKDEREEADKWRGWRRAWTAAAERRRWVEEERRHARARPPPSGTSSYLLSMASHRDPPHAGANAVCLGAAGASRPAAVSLPRALPYSCYHPSSRRRLQSTPLASPLLLLLLHFNPSPPSAAATVEVGADERTCAPAGTIYWEREGEGERERVSE